jgi:hypothetical protein
MQAELEAAQKGQVFERRHPLEVLWDALLGSDVLLQVLLRKQAAGELTADESAALGLAIDRATRTSKTAIDANLEQRWVQAQEGMARSHAARLIRAMDRVLYDPRVVIDGDPRQVALDALRAEEFLPEPLAISG